VPGQLLASVVHSSSTNRIAAPVAESSYPGTSHVGLGGIDTQGVALHLAEIPSFAIKIDCRIDLVESPLYFQQIIYEAEAHQIETKTVNVVFACPDLQCIEHQLAEHPMLRCGVRAAACVGVDIAVLVKAVVVSRHDFIENGKWILAGRRSVIVY